MTTRVFVMVADPGDSYAVFGRALWNALAPLHGEPPIYAYGETPWPTTDLDLASSDVVSHLLPCANVTQEDYVQRTSHAHGLRGR